MLTGIWEYDTQRGDNVLTQDYLMRMFMQLAAAMKESLLRARGENDPRVAADMLDAAISDATEMDGGLLLRMAPESMAAMLQLSQPDPSSWSTSRAHCCFRLAILQKRGICQSRLCVGSRPMR